MLLPSWPEYAQPQCPPDRLCACAVKDTLLLLTYRLEENLCTATMLPRTDNPPQVLHGVCSCMVRAPTVQQLLAAYTMNLCTLHFVSKVLSAFYTDQMRT